MPETVRNQVIDLYIATFQRAPDPEGLSFWVGQVEDDGLSLADVASNMFTSEEAQESFGDLDNEELITLLYNNLFDRDPDAEGLAYWVQQIEDGNMTREVAVANLVGGARADTGDATDAAILDARFDAAVAFVESGSDDMDEASAVIQNITRDQFENGDEPDEPGEPGDTFMLTPDADRLEGTADNDTFDAPITTVNFMNGNTLNTGDVLDGNGGDNVLSAELVNDAYITGYMGAVRPSTENIQTVEINAIETAIEDEVFPVVLDASRMLDVEHMGSYNSNANLEIHDVTTKTSDGDVRNTEELTFRMDHTSNDNTSDVSSASDLTVYFDENYLLAGVIPDTEVIQYEVMNQDAWDLINQDGRDDVELLDGVFFQRLDFDLNGERYELAPLLGEGGTDSDGLDIRTHEDLADAINAALVELGIDDVVTAEVGPDFQERSGVDGAEGRNAPAVVLTATPGNQLEVNENFAFLAAVDEPGEAIEGLRNSNRYDRAEDQVIEGRDEDVTTNVELHKVGRGDDGGDLHVGGKAGGSIPVVNVDVLGDDSKPSNIGWLGTGENQGGLEQVNIATGDEYADGDSYASLTIRSGFGNSDDQHQGGLLNVDADDFLGDLTVGTNQPVDGLMSLPSGPGVTNVAEFSAMGGGDITYNATFTGGNTHSVTTGNGDDAIVVNTGVAPNGSPNDGTAVDISVSGGDNFVFIGGPAPTGTVETGNGDDLIAVASSGEGESFVPAVPQEEVVTEEGSPSTLTIELVDTPTYGDEGLTLTFDFGGEEGVAFSADHNEDFDTTLGDLVAAIDAGDDFSAEIDGDGDLVITSSDNTDDGFDDVSLVDDDSGTSVVESSESTTGSPDDTDMQDIDVPDAYDFFDGKLQVSFGGVESEWVDIDSTDFRTSQEQIQAAIIEAVQGTKALADVFDGESLTSLISGDHGLEVDIRGPVAEDNGDGWDLDAGDADAWKPYLNEVSESDLEDAWEAYYPGSSEVEGDSGPGDFLSYIQGEAADANELWADFTGGPNPSNSPVSSVEINAGGGEDTIVLSSNTESADTVVFEGNFGENTIYNFNGEDAGGNDVLDFTSYLDVDAPGRGSSVDADVRAEEQVPFSFNNGDFDGDHNEIALLSFEDLVGWYVDSLDDGEEAEDLVSFADFGTSELEAALNENFSAFVEGGEDDSAIGNEFLILVSKDGEVIADADGDLSFEDEYATSEFKVFSGEVVEGDDDEDYAYQINSEHGLVDLAGVDHDDLAAADFGITA